MITETIEKRRLIVTLGEAQAPASWAWDAMRFLRNDDGSDAAPPQTVTVPCTEAEAAAYISQAMVDLGASISAKDAQIAVLSAQIATLTGERDQARAALAAVKSADTQWDAVVRPLVNAIP